MAVFGIIKEMIKKEDTVERRMMIFVMQETGGEEER